MKFFNGVLLGILCSERTDSQLCRKTRIPLPFYGGIQKWAWFGSGCNELIPQPNRMLSRNRVEAFNTQGSKPSK